MITVSYSLTISPQITLVFQMGVSHYTQKAFCDLYKKVERLNEEEQLLVKEIKSFIIFYNGILHTISKERHSVPYSHCCQDVSKQVSEISPVCRGVCLYEQTFKIFMSNQWVSHLVFQYDDLFDEFVNCMMSEILFWNGCYMGTDFMDVMPVSLTRN